MKRKLLARTLILILSIIILFIIVSVVLNKDKSSNEGEVKVTVQLPEPREDSKVSIETALCKRRSIRGYRSDPLKLMEISQLLWAAQGITSSGFYRTAPSAGALYPIEIYLVVGRVKDLAEGIYKYNPKRHLLTAVKGNDHRKALCSAALGQDFIKYAPAVIVISAVYERTTSKYRERGTRYVHMEAGHVAQNISLQAVSLDIGTVVIGAFYDDEVKGVIGLEKNEVPLCIMPVGKI